MGQLPPSLWDDANFNQDSLQQTLFIYRMCVALDAWSATPKRLLV